LRASVPRPASVLARAPIPTFVVVRITVRLARIDDIFEVLHPRARRGACSLTAGNVSASASGNARSSDSPSWTQWTGTPRCAFRTHATSSATRRATLAGLALTSASIATCATRCPACRRCSCSDPCHPCHPVVVFLLEGRCSLVGSARVDAVGVQDRPAHSCAPPSDPSRSSPRPPLLARPPRRVAACSSSSISAAISTVEATSPRQFIFFVEL